jgi:hypothetical protein
MKINLFTSKQNYKKNKKQSEVDYCIEKNQNLPIDFFFFREGYDSPAFAEFFQVINVHPNDINILCGPDVLIDEKFLVEILKFYSNANDEIKNTCLALSTWTKDSNGVISDKIDVRKQDVWVFFGRVKFDHTINDLNMGDDYGDLKLLSELIFKFGHKFINPYEQFKVYSYVEVEPTINDNVESLQIIDNQSSDITTEIVTIQEDYVGDKRHKLNILITCYNREDYIPHLVKIIESYKKIDANYAICYNGVNDDFECHFRTVYEPNNGRGNEGHQHGCPYAEADLDLLLGGYDYLKDNGAHLWVKLSADSWMIDEDKIIEILDELEKTNCAYAGNFWYEYKNVATDIFFSSTKVNNIFEDFKKHKTGFFDYLYEVKSMQGLEMFVGFISRIYDRLIIQNREPMQADSTRWGVKSLGWTMSHAIGNNLSFIETYVPDSNKVTFQIEKGHGTPFDIENNKIHIW